MKTVQEYMILKNQLAIMTALRTLLGATNTDDLSSRIAITEERMAYIKSLRARIKAVKRG